MHMCLPSRRVLERTFCFPPFLSAGYSCLSVISHAAVILLLCLLNVSFWFCVTKALFSLPLPLAPYNTR